MKKLKSKLGLFLKIHALCFFILIPAMAAVAQAPSEPQQLEVLADRIADAESGAVSVVPLKSLNQAFATMVKTGLLSVTATKKLKMNLAQLDLSELRYQDSLRQSQKLSANFPYLTSNFSLQSLHEQMQFDISGRIERFYDLKFESGTPQQFREKIFISEPKELSTLAFLTIRTDDPNIEDFFWYRSAGAEFAQELSQSLRDDPFLGTGISFNDFLGLSSKPDLFELQSEDILLDVFVPMINSDLKKSEAQVKALNGCAEIRLQPAPSFPIEVVAIKRRLIRLSLLVADPFSAIARRVIYLDADSFRPVFHEAYDHNDRLIRTQVTVLSPAYIENEEVLLPAVSVFKNAQDQSVTRTNYDDYLFCSSDSALTQAREFDPARLTSKSN